MNFEIISTAFAQSGAAAKGGAPIWPMLLALFAVFYFLMIRPQQKKQKETQNMISQLSRGDRVVTIGGIVGTIVNIKEKKDDRDTEDIIVLKVSDNTKIEMLRSSVSRVLSKQSEAVTKS
jgi:preprotein translocase subunit YajC